MALLRVASVLLAAPFICSGVSFAEQTPAAPANPLDAIPEKLPFNTPYGVPISASRAEAVIAAAASEAEKRGWPLNIAVVDSGGNLVSFLRMDGAQLASISISQHKARAALTYRRPTHIYEDAIQKSGYSYVLTLDGMITSRGGIPLIENGKIIGAIGCSGGTGSQDETVCLAGAAALTK